MECVVKCVVVGVFHLTLRCPDDTHTQHRRTIRKKQRRINIRRVKHRRKSVEDEEEMAPQETEPEVNEKTPAAHLFT